MLFLCHFIYVIFIRFWWSPCQVRRAQRSCYKMRNLKYLILVLNARDVISAFAMKFPEKLGITDWRFSLYSWLKSHRLSHSKRPMTCVSLFLRIPVISVALKSPLECHLCFFFFFCKVFCKQESKQKRKVWWIFIGAEVIQCQIAIQAWMPFTRCLPQGD